MKWVCCQLGQRESYLVPRSLIAQNLQPILVTDAWLLSRPWARPLGRWIPGLSSRFSRELANSRVLDATFSRVVFESFARMRGLRDWRLTLLRNDWFGAFSSREVSRVLREMPDRGTVFSYSYTALETFRVAKKAGWRCVLGQIDCGRRHEEIRQDVATRYPWLREERSTPPQRYWDQWGDECALADEVVVNSRWAESCLRNAGVPGGKVKVVPLPDPLPAAARAVERHYPGRFSRERPLRVLFVGQVTLAKGIGAILEASVELASEPVEFWIVGPMRVEAPGHVLAAPNIRWYGRVPQAEVDRYYRQADVLLFPSHCDGFGLVQVEAQREGLPVISSRNCGDVVEDGVNGIRLSEVSCDEIAAAVRSLYAAPDRLRHFSDNSGRRKWTVADYGRALLGDGRSAS